MLSSAPLRTSDLRRRNSQQTLTVCVVDPQAEDYQGWRERSSRVEVVASAEAALRFAQAHQVDLWVVNTVLPGLSGHELCSMLKARSSRTPVYLVADEYSPEAERQAWASRATSFGVKPTHLEWLNQWLAPHANLGSSQ